MSGAKSKREMILEELREHLPFTLLGTGASIIVLALVHFFFVNLVHLSRSDVFENFFHLFHFSHVFLSAIATSAIFYRQEKRVLKTIAVGFSGTLIFCGMSDALLPFFGGLLLGVPMDFHLCLIEEPAGVLASNALGIWTGIVLETRLGKISYFSHGMHVFVSSLASLFYLVTFGVDSWTHVVLWIFVITTVAVVIPCCSSDIVMPISFLRSAHHGHEHEDEHTREH